MNTQLNGYMPKVELEITALLRRLAWYKNQSMSKVLERLIKDAA